MTPVFSFAMSNETSHRNPGENFRKQCRHCGELKALAEFPTAQRTKDGLSSWCRTCHVEATRNWKTAHREEHLRRRREQYASRRQANQ